MAAAAAIYLQCNHLVLLGILKVLIIMHVKDTLYDITKICIIKSLLY